MKKRIAFFMLAAAMLVLAACGSKAVTTPSAAETEQTQETQVQEAQAAEATAQPTAPLEYAGVYCQTWNEEIGGTVVEQHSYYVLNEDHTGYLFAQAVAGLTWDEGKLTENIGVTYDIALTQENGTVKLLVYQFQDKPSVFNKIEKLPAEIEAMLAEFIEGERAQEMQVPAPEYPGVYCQTWNEEIGGTVVERNTYIVLNADYTGNWIVQEVGTVTWNESQMTDNLGLTYSIALTQENGTVKLLVYEFQDNPTVYEKIEKLPADIESMISMS